MKKLTRTDLKTIRSYAVVEEECEKMEGMLPSSMINEIKEVLRDSYQTKFGEKKVKTTLINSFEVLEEFIYNKKPGYSLGKKEDMTKYRYYFIGKSKEGDNISTGFDSTLPDYVVINRPMVILLHDETDVIDVVYMNTNTIKLSPKEYKVYKDLYAE